jgi:thioredoxin-related protein
MRDEFPETKIRVIAVFPPASVRTTKTVLYDRWKIANIPGYMDGTTALFAGFGVEVVPTSALIDAAGEVVEYYEGFPGEEEITRALRSVTK